MAAADPHGKELKNTGYEIFVGALSVLSIVNIVLLYVADDPQLNKIIWVMNALLQRDLSRRLHVPASYC